MRLNPMYCLFLLTASASLPLDSHVIAQQRRPGASPPRAYMLRLTPHWLASGDKFWYRRDLPGGEREYVMVDAARGERGPAFDHAKLADALQRAGVRGAGAERLPLVGLQFADPPTTCEFGVANQTWHCDLQTYEVRRVVDRTLRQRLRPLDSRTRSRQSDERINVRFVNQTNGPVRLVWVDTRGYSRSYGVIAPGQQRRQSTFAGHVWEITDANRQWSQFYRADSDESEVVIDGKTGNQPTLRSSRRRPRGESPDGKWTAVVRDHNVALIDNETGSEMRVSRDGAAEHSYELLQWSPNSKYLAAFRVQPGDQGEVHLIESSPGDSPRGKLTTQRYTLPGDRMNSYELNLFVVESGRLVRPELEPIDFGRPRLRWRDDGRRLLLEKTDRGHQRFRLIEVDARSGESRNIIDEKSETFIWSAHGPDVPRLTYLRQSEQVIFASERSGWRHLYLVDLDQPSEVIPITRGEWVVRSIDRIDEEADTVWFSASGRHAGQDPYLIHQYRVGLDGGGMTALTSADGNHQLRYSPNRKYFIDSYSRADSPPVHELHKSEDGSLVCEVERADVRELAAVGIEAPEVFVAKGRDGTTDIWGLIYRPRDFDPARKYPIVEHIYAGPHDSHVPKSYSAIRPFRQLTELGFVVVKIDGMGTANRSKRFHDVCWQNLRDAGLPDRIAWIKAAAEKYPSLDTERVGIMGTSAGGQNAAAAALFHGDFYKAAVAACGCHDNRMDKASWNEQWMGYPVGPQYARSSNIDNAARLEAELMLIVGELDTNVPPASTLRFVDALIEHNKDFELLVLPDAGHTSGGAYGLRRSRDFLVRHLRPETLVTSHAPQPDASRGVADLVAHYQADLGSLTRYHRLPESPERQQRLARFYRRWMELLKVAQGEVSQPELAEPIRALQSEVESALEALHAEVDRLTRVRPLTPFTPLITPLIEARQRVAPIDPQQAAEKVADIAKRVVTAQRQLEESKTPSAGSEFWTRDLREAAASVKRLRAALSEWNGFYAGYHPSFQWWLKQPFEELDSALNEYAEALEAQAEAARSPTPHRYGEVQQLLQQPPAVMPALIERYRSESARFSRRGRRRSQQNAAQGSLKEHYASWREQLDRIDFDSLANSDRIDWLLLDNRLRYDRQRLEMRESGGDRPAPAALDQSGILGSPVGRQRLEAELAYEWIPYRADELVEIAEQEYAWCKEELLKASRELGFGDRWKEAVEHVKTLHVKPGEQPKLIRRLAEEAIDYLEKHQLVTVPPLAKETWRMQMMSPRRQLVNPFFTGGEVISVSFPTDSMTHRDKLQSMRGNNLPFARATVHHELIPGHHLQIFMNARHRSYRRLFTTPFWLEGWALYWEMVLYDRGFPATPEDRVGFLVWRSHRCARIIFSLNFHLGQMTPQECVDLLVDKVGFERNNAAAEVRRSVGLQYPPLYQAAYMLGGLQFRALRRELVDGGVMGEREFHDRILRQNQMPIELLRHVLKQEAVDKGTRASWRFYSP